MVGAFLALEGQELERPVTIVAFGDSTTAPRGAVTVYPLLLQEELRQVQVINAGVPGNTTTMARQRFESDVLAKNPEMVIIQFGINDSAVDVWKQPAATVPRVALETYEANLRYFVQSLKARKAAVVLMTPNPLRWTARLKEMYGRAPYLPDEPDGFNVTLNPYAEKVRLIAAEEKVELVDVPPAMAARAAEMKGSLDQLLADGMHPNDEGHRVVGNQLKTALLKMAQERKLSITSAPAWQASGTTAIIHPAARDITFDSPHDTVLGSGLVLLKDRTTMMAVYSTPSSYYSKPGTVWIAARRTLDGGKSWEMEQVVARHPDCQPSHPSVLVSKDGTIHVFYLGFKKWAWHGVNPASDTASDIWTTRSKDQGSTWSVPQRIFTGYSGATNGAVETADGKLVVPFSHYVNNPGRLVSRVAISADGGRSWDLGAPLDMGGAGDHEGALEPAVLPLNDGRIWMLIRTTRKVFWEAYSSDGGLNWTVPGPTTIDASSAPASLTRLRDGRVALVWNQRSKGRRELQLALSSDDGKSWSRPVPLVRGKSVTYPSVIEGPSDGDLWIGYHDVANGWNSPRARQMRANVNVLETVKRE
ncbi:exo-alpha-sialidase [Verrucomicrobium spinosum]|nr:exo-alpha-sialidase [Verrucomicrobium spinosum]